MLMDERRGMVVAVVSGFVTMLAINCKMVLAENYLAMRRWGARLIVDRN